MSPQTARSSSCRHQVTHLGTSLWLSWMAMSITSWRATRHTHCDPSLKGKSMASVPIEAVSLQTMRRIVQYARSQPTVYLPAHDPESGDRLAKGITVPISEDVTA